MLRKKKKPDYNPELSMEENFNKETCIDTLRILPGHQTLKEMPHYDTLNDYLERLKKEYPRLPVCIQGNA